MMKNQKGFSVVESLLIAVIAGLIGFVGWYVWSSQSKTNKILDSTSTGSVSPKKKTAATKQTQPADPYASWKEYCSKQEGSCFKYPSNWTFTQSGASDPAGDGATISSPNGSRVIWSSAVDGLGGGCPPEQPHVYINKVTPLTSVADLYLVETGSQSAILRLGLVGGESKVPQLGDTGTCLYYTIFQPKHSSAVHAWLMAYNTNNQNYDRAINQDRSISQKDLPTAEKILLSYHY